MKNSYTYLDKMIDWILANAHCISTGYIPDGIEAIYRMKNGDKYRITLNNEYELIGVSKAA